MALATPSVKSLVLLSTAKIQTIFRNGFILLGFCWCSRLDITCQCILVKKCLYVRHANIVQEVKTCYKIKINSRESKSCFYGFSGIKATFANHQKPHSTLIAPLLQSKSVTIARQYLRYWVVIAALWHPKSATWTTRLFTYFFHKPHNRLCISNIAPNAQNSRISHQRFCYAPGS